ncbi:m-phase phospho protein 1, partial [Trichinella spiralis]|uniref:m-phase phospho protein 1 n=1 Tax=Trichinella spiralis TaxID=6334 RepID=UPI0001EFE0B0
GNASEIKSIADKCLKATKNEFSKQVETFTIYENSTLSLHESVKALMAECEQLNEDLKTKENASENMKQKIEEAQKSIAGLDCFFNETVYSLSVEFDCTYRPGLTM